MSKTVKTAWAEIYMAGDIADAKSVCRHYCYHHPLCVTVDATCFIYTGGEEAGFCVGLINYPRFPSNQEIITKVAIDLAEELRAQLCQHSFSVVTPTETIWCSERSEHES